MAASEALAIERLAAGDVQHLKLSTGLGVARSVGVRVSAHATPHDRTAG